MSDHAAPADDAADPRAARKWLDLAARLGLRGGGDVEPNPMVGAVLVNDGRLVGCGHHRRFGGPHAEREALDDCSRRGETASGATCYVTLEPCNHHGKQPPCAAALADAGVARVVYARADPDPAAAGGARFLGARGVRCEQSDASPLATGLAAPFAKRIATGLPWVIAKWAQTIDGRIATRTGESKWISGAPARVRVHRLRARVDAVLTGIGTVLADDPMLTARDVSRVRRVARRVVADTDLDIPLTSALVRTAREWPTIVACERSLTLVTFSARKRAAFDQAGVELLSVADHAPGRGLDLRELLTLLARHHGVATVLVESGPGLLGSLFDDDLIDEAVVYVAPMLLGDELARSVAVGRVAASLTQARRFRLCRVKRLGDDVELTYRREAVPATPAPGTAGQP